MFKIIVIGAVKSTQRTILELLKFKFDLIGIIGHEPKNIRSVSGWVDLSQTAKNFEIDYKGFKKINDNEVLIWAKEKKPDIIFAVGFSQLLSEDWLNMPKIGCIGFHPTMLPRGRGRAPLAWLIINEQWGAASFFLMGTGADNGPIFIQEPFKVEKDDDAKTLETKIDQSITLALNKWLPKLKNGEWNPLPQNEALATWYGKRSIEDGLINWQDNNIKIDKIIKASTFPHPGAYTYFKDEKLLILSSNIETNLKITGITGRVLKVDNEKGYLVQCGQGLLWINQLFLNKTHKISVGDKLGYQVEDEIFNLKGIIKTLIK